MSGWVRIEPRISPLTARERRVAELLDMGLSAGQIARQLRVRLEFVMDDIHHIQAKRIIESEDLNMSKWSTEETNTAISMYRDGKSCREIAEAIGRPEGATAVKLCALRKQGVFVELAVAHATVEETEPAAEEETAPTTVAVPEIAIDILSEKAEDLDRQILLINQRLQELTEDRDTLREWLNYVRRA